MSAKILLHLQAVSFERDVGILQNNQVVVKQHNPARDQNNTVLSSFPIPN